MTPEQQNLREAVAKIIRDGGVIDGIPEDMADAAIAVALKEAANVCKRRYMGDNTREDMEAWRCAAAILALIPTASHSSDSDPQRD